MEIKIKKLIEKTNIFELKLFIDSKIIATKIVTDCSLNDEVNNFRQLYKSLV